MALGVGVGAAATAVTVVMRGAVGLDLPFVAFFPALIAAAAWGGFLGGLTCLAVATVAATALRLPPDPPIPWAIGVFWIAGGLIVAVAAALTDTVRELRQRQAKLADAQAQLQTLVGELAHRNRNALFVIMAIVSQSARGAASGAEAEKNINARLQALLRAQDVVVQSDSGAVNLRPLLEKALEPFDLARFEIAPPPEMEITSELAVGLGLLFHELATNALKYGALSQAGGRVCIAWGRDGEIARCTWREVGGPAVAPPLTKGFGSRLLDVALVPQGGKAERRFDPDGVVCELHIPPAAPDRTRSPIPPGAVFARALTSENDRTGTE
ncbi:MAG TPA: HWE histidine kinase domain-containing protein [Caulobacteraceae bacterium]|nr:HWE histidine kinase domain-containing protein [Caulobacteraceae bacterium]